MQIRPVETVVSAVEIEVAWEEFERLTGNSGSVRLCRQMESMAHILGPVRSVVLLSELAFGRSPRLKPVKR